MILHQLEIKKKKRSGLEKKRTVPFFNLTKLRFCSKIDASENKKEKENCKVVIENYLTV